MSHLEAARRIWTVNGLPKQALERLHLSPQPDPAVDSQFKLGTAAQTSIGLSALAAAQFHELRTGEAQEVAVDARRAAIEFNSEKYYLVDGQPTNVVVFDELADIYETRAGHIRLQTSFPHHKKGTLEILGLDSTANRTSVATALKSWTALDFEREAIRRGVCATALRSFDEMYKTLYPNKDKDISSIMPISITKIGDAPKREVKDGEKFNHALEGVKVIDMTRVLAGPISGRTLAAHGADVLWLTSPNLPALHGLDIDTSRGKRTAQLDLNSSSSRSHLQHLLSQADVFLQAYRPGSLANRGFSSKEVAKLRPGIVCASLSAYPRDSAWKDVRGFDSLVQTMGGFNVAEAEAYAEYMRAQGLNTDDLPPYRQLPMQALDHAAGYFLAFGIAAALCKTITDGGSYEVHVSLTETMLWIKSLGTVDVVQAFAKGLALPLKAVLPHREIDQVYTTLPVLPDGEGKGEEHTLTAIRHSAVMGRTPVRDVWAPMRRDAHEATW
ncbi:CoA-transferase family III, partial [Peniophora sp. CONT]